MTETGEQGEQSDSQFMSGNKLGIKPYLDYSVFEIQEWTDDKGNGILMYANLAEAARQISQNPQALLREELRKIRMQEQAWDKLAPAQQQKEKEKWEQLCREWTGDSSAYHLYLRQKMWRQEFEATKTKAMSGS